jgi:hypothetical protein
MTKMLCAAVVAAGLVVVPLLAPAQGQGEGPATSLEELVSSMADTPEEHKAVADYFRDKAKRARAEEETHRRMGRNYAGGKVTAIQKMKGHCDKIAESQATIAKEYEELARLHDEVAKGKAPKP